jgi:hypothetical protein
MENDKLKNEQQCAIHDVILRCCNCGNVETQQFDQYERLQFIEQDCCDKCNDDIERQPSQSWYDAEYNAI